MAVPHFPRRNEHEAAFYAYRAGMARIANAAAFIALARWRAQVAALRPDANAAYIPSLVSVVFGARRLGRRLTQSWYQYTRALDSGYQYGDSEGLEDDHDLTQENLRQLFWDRLQDAASLGHELSEDADQREFEQALLDENYGSSDDSRAMKLNRELIDRELQEVLDQWGEDRELQYDPYQWSSDSSPEDIARYLDRELRQMAREQSRERRRKLDEESREREVSDEEHDEAHRSVGQKIAGEVHKLVSDAADSNIRRALSSDGRVMSVARGTALRPCSFCAMLASRGFAYSSVATASVKVHPNCNCYPIVRWTRVTNEDDLPEINNWYRKLWEESTRGLAGADARNAFRRRLNQEFGDSV